MILSDDVYEDEEADEFYDDEEQHISAARLLGHNGKVTVSSISCII